MGTLALYLLLEFSSPSTNFLGTEIIRSEISDVLFNEVM